MNEQVICPKPNGCTDTFCNHYKPHKLEEKCMETDNNCQFCRAHFLPPCIPVSPAPQIKEK